MDRKIQPLQDSNVELDFTNPEKILVGNGIPVYLIHGGQQDVVRLEFLFSGGTGAEKKFLTGEIVNELIQSGTRWRSAEDLAEWFEFYGASVYNTVSPESASVSVVTISKFIDEILPVFYEMLSEPEFPDKEIELHCEQSRQRLQIQNQKVGFVAHHLMLQKMFGQHSAYGYYPEEKDFDSINRESLKEFHKKNYINGILGIIVAGNITSKVLKSLQNNHSGNLIMTLNESNHEMDFLLNRDRNIDLIWSHSLQTAISMGKPTVSRNHPDYFPMYVLNCVLGGYFGSRLMMNIREEKGFSYGISSSISAYMKSAYLYIQTQVNKSNRMEASREIENELEKLRTHLIPEEELGVVKNYLIGHLQRIFDGPFSRASRFRNLLLHRLDFDHFKGLFEAVREISPDKLKIMAEKHLDPASFFRILVG